MGLRFDEPTFCHAQFRKWELFLTCKASLDSKGKMIRNFWVRFQEKSLFHKCFALSCLIGIFVPLAFAIDLSVANACRSGILPGELKAILLLSEVVAHGYGVAAILLVLAQINPSIRRKLLRVALCAIIPGICVTLLKGIIGRHRPGSFTGELPNTVWDTFAGVAPGIFQGDAGLLFDRTIQSFPSGHSACAVGFAIGLSWLFPRGKYCFAFFAMLALMQRVNFGAHFLSDTLAGSIVAITTIPFVFGPSKLGTWLSKFETSDDSGHLKLTPPAETANESQSAA